MSSKSTVNIAIAQVAGASCKGVIDAVAAEHWRVDLAADVNELTALAESGTYHMVILASGEPHALPRTPVRSLMSLQTDMSLIFLVPDRRKVTACPALAGSTFDQVFDLDSPPESLLETVRREIQSVLSSQDEYLIMCVDDDEDFLRSLEAFLPRRLTAALPRFGLDFDFFTDSREALAAVEELSDRQLAVVISDQVMPRMEGIELLSRVKALCPDARRVLLTGQAGLDSAVAAINSQVLDKYFFKPVEDPEDFSNNVQLLLRDYCLRMRADAQRERLMAQFEYVRAISGAQNVDSALALTVQFLHEQVCPRSIVFLLAEEDQLVVRAGHNLPADLTVGAPVGAEDGICKWMLQQRRPVLAARAEELPCQITEPFVSLPVMAAPLVWGDAALGVVLATGRCSARPFSRSERMLISFIVDAASVTVGGLRDRAAIERHYVATMSSLMETVEAKDGYTRGHTDRVTDLAIGLAKAVGATGDLLASIRHAASLHDIGKIAVPDKIIFKPSSLDSAEFAVMKEHPERGDRILQHLRFLDSARRIIRSHHERYDGKGYPDGLQGEDIPLGARILAIADSYDAMTSARPYREAMRPADALVEIEINAGKQFDPKLAQAFLNMIGASEGHVPSPGRGARSLAAQESER